MWPLAARNCRRAGPPLERQSGSTGSVRAGARPAGRRPALGRAVAEVVSSWPAGRRLRPQSLSVPQHTRLDRSSARAPAGRQTDAAEQMPPPRALRLSSWCARHRRRSGPGPTGFRAVDERLARRMAACACPNLIDRPNRAVYALAAPRDGKICAACGCPVAAKEKTARKLSGCRSGEPRAEPMGEVRSPGG